MSGRGVWSRRHLRCPAMITRAEGGVPGRRPGVPEPDAGPAAQAARAARRLAAVAHVHRRASDACPSPTRTPRSATRSTSCARRATTTPSRPGSARDLCRQWADAGWLVRQVLDDDVEVYRLSAHAVGALEVAGRAGGARARVSQSRVRTMLDAVERLAQDADPDVLVRMARLDAEIKRLQAELDRIQRTGTVERSTTSSCSRRPRTSCTSRASCPRTSRGSPSRSRRCSATWCTALRQDERPTGDVLREYLERGEHVMESTSEGRAFAGCAAADRRPAAARRARGPARRRAAAPVHQRLAAAAARRAARDRPPDRAGPRPGVRRAARGVVRHHRAGPQPRPAAGPPGRRPAARRHDRAAGVAAATRGAARPSTRCAGCRSRRSTTCARPPGDLRPPQPPAPLADWDDGGRRRLRTTRRAPGAARTTPTSPSTWRSSPTRTGAVDVAAAFNAAPDALRRPVDLLGLLEIARPATA